ncbi:MAG: hypothetical protein M1358_22675 [Chloroflexi bacterium]|nr:hypothetical protein [Chloroflexota bacterium]
MTSPVARASSSAGTIRSLPSISILIYLLAGAAAADLVTLFRNIPLLGLHAEVNPVALFFLVNFGPLGLVAAKAASVLLASGIAIFLMRSGQLKLARTTLAICCLATIMAALSNIWSA